MIISDGESTISGMSLLSFGVAANERESEVESLEEVELRTQFFPLQRGDSNDSTELLVY